MTAHPGDSTISTVVGKLLRRTEEGGDERIHLGAFGKHPGWGDFLSEGLDTHRLIGVRDRLLVQGIGGNLQSGAWGDPQDRDLQNRFRQVLLWHLPQDVVVGRMWPSQDAKGRRYPMLVCAQCRRLPVDWLLREVLPRLEDAEQRCSAAGSADDVVSILDVTRRELRLQAEDVPDSAPVTEAGGPALARLAEHLPEGEQRIHRVFYEIQRQMGGYLPDSFRPGAAAEGRPPARMRIPRCTESPEEALQLWTDFMLTQLHPDSPLLLLQPLDYDWLDVIAGAPTADELFCLAVGQDELPLATDIPFTLDDEFVEDVDRAVKDARSGGDSFTPARAEGGDGGVERQPIPSPPGGGLPKPLWIIITVVVILLILLAALLFGGGGGPPEPEAEAPGPAPAAEDAPGSAYSTTYEEWFGELYARAREHHDQWVADPWLNRNVVQALAGARATGTEFDPGKGSDGQPEERAVSTTRAIEAAFELADWPLLEQVRRFAQRAEQLGWPQTAARLRASADRVRPAPGLADGVEEVLTHAKILQQWRATEEVAGRIDGREHAFLPPMVATVAAWAAEADAAGGEALVTRLENARGHLSVVDSAAQTLETGLAGMDGKGDSGSFYAYLRDFLQPGGAGDVEALASRLRDLASDVEFVLQVAGRWRRVEELRRAIAAAGSDSMVVDAFSGYAAGRMEFKRQGLRALADRLAGVEEVGRKLKEFLEENGQRVAWHSFQPREEELFREPVGAEDLEAWLADAPDYFRLTEDFERDAEEWQQALTMVEKDIGCQPEARRPALRGRLDALKEKVAAYPSVTPVAMNRARVRAEKEEAAAAVRGLREDVPSCMPPREWLSAMRGRRRISDSGAINTEWERRRDRLLGDVTAAGLQADRSLYVDRRTRIEDIEKSLKDIEKLFPAVVELPAGRGWKDALREALPEEREEAIRRALEQTEWERGTPAGTDAARREAAAFEKLQRDLARLVADFERLEQMMELAYRPDEAPADEQGTIARILDRWKRHDVMARSWVAGAIAPAMERVDALIAADSRASRAELLSLVETSDRPELVLTAWRRLGRIEQPAGTAPLRAELDLRATVRAAIEGIPSEQRRGVLHEEYRAEQKRRWLDCVQGLAAQNSVAEAVRMCDEFTVDGEGALPPRVRYNVLRMELEDLLSGAPSEGQVRRRVEDFAAAVRALPDGVSDVPAVSEALAGLEELLDSEQQPEQVPPGPAAVDGADWQVQADEFPRRFAYHWAEKGHELIFERVQPTGSGASPAYLCVTEVPVGLFTDAVEAAGLWDEMRPHLDARRGLMRQGPRCWVSDRQRIVIADRWVCEDPVWSDISRYAEGVGPGEGGGPLPNADSPMSYLSGAGARLFAEQILQCRLPRPGEWEAARAACETAAGAEPGWNLRDRTWLRQWEYVNGMVGEHMLSRRLPLDGSFDVRGPDGAGAPETLDADDGLLWFQNVNEGSPGPFLHLVGNVAEFLCDEAGRFYGGGPSALSSPEIGGGPEPLESEKSMFADVGVRLAITPSGGTLLWNVQQASRRLPWLTASGG